MKYFLNCYQFLDIIFDYFLNEILYQNFNCSTCKKKVAKWWETGVLDIRDCLENKLLVLTFACVIGNALKCFELSNRSYLIWWRNADSRGYCWEFVDKIFRKMENTHSVEKTYRNGLVLFGVHDLFVCVRLKVLIWHHFLCNYQIV